MPSSGPLVRLPCPGFASSDHGCEGEVGTTGGSRSGDRELVLNDPASKFTIALAAGMDAGEEVVLIDSNAAEVRAASRAALTALPGNATDEDVLERADAEGRSTFTALPLALIRRGAAAPTPEP